MAITALEHMVLSSLREHRILPARPAVLELGESNWYGDVPTEQVRSDIDQFIVESDERARRLAQLDEILDGNRGDVLYEIARLFFQVVLDPCEYSAIDPGTPGSRYRFDLNLPVPLEQQFDLLLNIGTAEHVFNIYQFFKTAHERTRPGGLMMHTSPFTGWVDHGFYNFQPTFYFDLARVNGYDMLSMVVASFRPLRYVQIRSHEEIPLLASEGKLPANAHVNVVMRKTGENPFAVPVQGYYAGTLTPDARRLWHELR